jgi:DNA-binding transcriptional LysR family regulator
MPRVLRKLYETYPDFGLIIRDGPSKALIEDLLAGTHDLILTQALSPAATSNCRSSVLSTMIDGLPPYLPGRRL